MSEKKVKIKSQDEIIGGIVTVLSSHFIENVFIEDTKKEDEDLVYGHTIIIKVRES